MWVKWKIFINSFYSFLWVPWESRVPLSGFSDPYVLLDGILEPRPSALYKYKNTEFWCTWPSEPFRRKTSDARLEWWDRVFWSYEFFVCFLNLFVFQLRIIDSCQKLVFIVNKTLYENLLLVLGNFNNTWQNKTLVKNDNFILNLEFFETRPGQKITWMNNRAIDDAAYKNSFLLYTIT